MDIKTILISYLITNAICAGVIWVLYVQNRKHFNGLEFWLTAYLMQFAGLILITMRGYLPEFISVVVGNGTFIGGTVLLYMGLERFLGKRSKQIHNIILLALFVAAHTYFLVFRPSMTALSLNLSLALVVLCAQFVWLIFRRADVNLRPVVREAGFLFAAYGVVSLIHICVNLVAPLGEDYFQLDLFNTIIVFTYQMLFIALTFSLFMMVNRCLHMKLGEDIAEHKQTSEALKQSEQLYRQMFIEHSAVKLLVDPSNGSIVQANSAAAQFYGYTVEELQAMNIAQINVISPDAIAEAMQKALQRKANYFIFQHRLASGEVRDVEVHSSPTKVSGRELLYSIIHDITERKQAESQREVALEKLRESEERLRLAVSAGRMGIWDRNFVTGQLNWSVECKAMFGLPPETEMNDERFMNALHPDDRLPVDIAIRESQAKQTDFNTEYRVIWPDGTLHWISALGHWYYDETGQAIRMAGATLDITERKQTETALRESRETLTLFINQSPIYAYIKEVTPTQSRVMYASENFADMIGIPGSEMVGKTMEELFPADFAAKITADDWTVASGEGILNQEEELNGRQYITIKFPLLRTGRANLLAGYTIDITERKQAEEKLRESESLYESLVNQLPQNLYRIALDGEVLFINKTYQQNLGAPLEDILGKIAYDLSPEDKAIQYREEDAQVIASGKPLTLIDENISPVTGQISYNEGIKIPVFDKDGNVRGIQGIFYDITERKQAEEKLRASEERFRQLIVSAPDAVFMVDEEGKITFANREATNLLGYAFDEFIGMAVEDLIPQKFRGSHIADRKKYMGDSHTRLMGPQLNLIAVDKKGNEIPVDIKLSPVKMEAGTQVIAFMRDITERKRAEEEHNRLARLVDASPASITIHDETGKFLYANQKTFDLHGFSREEFMALSLHQLDVPESEQLIEERLKEIMERGEASFEVRHFRRDASTFPLQVNVRSTIRDNKTVFESIAVDITELKLAQEELIKAKEAAEESETRFSKSLEFSPTPIALAEISGKLIFLNKNFTDTYGYTLQDIATIDQWMLKAYPDPEYRNSLTQIWGQDAEYAIKNNTNTPMRECQVTCKSGDVKTVEVTSYFQKQLFIGHFQDVSERKRAENDLRATHKALQMQFDEINALKELLQEQAIRDPLTNLHNRRYLDETLGHEVARAKRENYPIGIILIDIDRFKKFNDTYGHSTGDEILKSLSRLLVDSVRQGDIACRYGGEEFLVVMIGAHETDVERRAEAICRDFSKLRIKFEGQELSATVSVGIAFYPKHGVDIQQVIRAADAAMYHAKEAGRNQVQAWAGV